MKTVKNIRKHTSSLKNGPVIALAGLMLISLSHAALADSARIKSLANGHYYQEINNFQSSWSEAQAACKLQGAHLATITSEAENSFIYTYLRAPNDIRTWIGGSDAVKEGTYTWVSGEKFAYSNFGILDTNPNNDYLSLQFYSAPGKWLTAKALDTGYYICEWDTPSYIGITNVPDINNDGYDETAVLYIDIAVGVQTVKIRDPQTDTNLSTLTFLTSFTPPHGLVGLNDLNGNAIPEIGVLFNDAVKNQPAVGIKDVKNNATLIKTILFLDNTYEPKIISVSPDSNANGADEITVLGINKTTGKAKSETRDSGTGALLNDTLF